MADHSKATTAADPQGKTLTLFFDGTADKFGASNSNVIKLQQLLDKDATTQKIYYQVSLRIVCQCALTDTPRAAWSRHIHAAIPHHTDYRQTRKTGR